MGRVKFDRPATARTLHTFLTLTDRLHPAALLVLVLVLVGLAYGAAPILVTLLTALVDLGKSVALLAGAGILARLAIRAAAAFTVARQAEVAA